MPQAARAATSNLKRKKMEFYKYTLPNGIRGIHRQVRSGVVHCALAVNAGSRDELPSEYGLAHFTEHGFFKGTTRRKAHQVNCRLENLGGELNAYTTKEDTTIHATVLKNDFAKAAELISDVAFESVFPERELAKEREVIDDEINTYKDSPPEMIFDQFEDMLFAGSELGHNILGTKQALKRYGTDSIMSFRRRTHTTDQMVFASIGNISPETAERIAVRYFSERQATAREYERTVPPLCGPFEKRVVKHTHQIHCIVGNRAYSIRDTRRLPLALLVNILGGPSANSLLNVVIREKHGLSYNIEASYTPYADSGIVAVYFSSDSINADFCLELIDAQIKKLQNTHLTPRQLSMAKRQFMAQLAISMEGNEGYMLGLGKSLLVHNEVDTLDDICRKIDALRAEQLTEAANEIFTNNSILMYR